MKVSYDSEADAAYIKLSDETPNGGTELGEGIILHSTQDNRIVAIEILDVSKKFSVEELYRFEVERAEAA
ncbi:DUF2283 domain-containing protein [candidate division KSB1 bacterium]|nr:DUF2283 domain-containing protein [candidate division KSB1 bacterium]NIR72602.1 DUF2283 domain-containing protein [candidate division KSB1 bacterium]NIS23980.1 DUF2283 domain-containing protein [candidate division KSB1 bacterium]NIT70903.1 DUF2283 domain-containing protein [candidate division KSB1 bacterium]NIU24630.1 DUF2283 domain-containing protein [candidate division KSB1 bacterium]